MEVGDNITEFRCNCISPRLDFIFRWSIAADQDRFVFSWLDGQTEEKYLMVVVKEGTITVEHCD